MRTIALLKIDNGPIENLATECTYFAANINYNWENEINEFMQFFCCRKIQNMLSYLYPKFHNKWTIFFLTNI